MIEHTDNIVWKDFFYHKLFGDVNTVISKAMYSK